MAKASDSKKLKIGIIGATSVSAGKLLEILLRHPMAEISVAVSETSPGAPLWKYHPQLRARLEKTYDTLDLEKLADCDVVFSCKRAGESFAYIDQLLKSFTRVIDLSGDFRLKFPEEFEQWYGIEHKHPQLLDHAVYGLPEWYRSKIKDARFVANPGCYTTTSILGCAPLVKAGFGKEAPIIIDAISGVSGAGRAAKAENLYLNVSENVRAYRIGNHQHTPEIEQELWRISQGNGAAKVLPASQRDVQVLFVPHVGPFKAGIMANCYLRCSKPGVSEEQLYGLLKDAYAAEPFVRVYEPGVLPQIDYVVGTNYCDIGVKYDARTQTIVVVSVTDNTVKGAAGQAVQNMNIMLGLEENSGLE